MAVIIHDTIALFCKDDSEIGFYCRTTKNGLLQKEVFRAMFGVDYDAEHVDEVEGIVTQLQSEGYVGFEDGWLELRTGVDDVTSFFMAKLAEAKEEERHSDQQRYEELKRRQTAEEWYAGLCTALTRALGPAGADEVREAIVAGKIPHVSITY